MFDTKSETPSGFSSSPNIWGLMQSYRVWYP